MDYYVSAKWGVNALEQAHLITDIAQKAPGNSANTTIQVFPGLDHDFRSTADVCSGAELDLENKWQIMNRKVTLRRSKINRCSESDDLRQIKPAIYSKDFQQNFQQWVLSKFP